ncbi:MAG: FecR domain-containing protein [Desulfobacterales bacterium]|nr:FecR domain-containing protein [Desulfobacterales bacterium]
MKKSRAIRVFTVLAALACVSIAGAGPGWAAEPLLPPGLVVEKDFTPGVGVPVGAILMVRGNVVIIHKENKKRGFRAGKDTPLYKGDAVVTPGKSRARFELNDGSVMAMGPRSRLVVDKSVYDRKRKTRQSFLSLSLGKVRFWVVKAFNLKRSEFKVRTKTSIGGVRGSDFVAVVTEEGTEWITLEDTLLEVWGAIDPDSEPILLEDFEQTIVKVDSLPTDKWKVTPEEVMEIKNTLTISMTRRSPHARPKDAAAEPPGGPKDKSDKPGLTGTPPPRRG